MTLSLPVRVLAPPHLLQATLRATEREQNLRSKPAWMSSPNLGNMQLITH